MPDETTERELTRTFTGLVVESLHVGQDFGAATVACRECSGRLSAGDRVTVAFTCYEDHSWEIEAVYCVDHAVASVRDVMGVRAERQAVVAATLEPTGYRPPAGRHQPDALTLGEVAVREFSPTAAGY